MSLKHEADPVDSRIEGRVDNTSPYRVTDVRLLVEGLDGGQSSFVFEAMPGAVTYGISVVSYDVVSAP